VQWTGCLVFHCEGVNVTRIDGATLYAYPVGSVSHLPIHLAYDDGTVQFTRRQIRSPPRQGYRVVCIGADTTSMNCALQEGATVGIGCTGLRPFARDKLPISTTGRSRLAWAGRVGATEWWCHGPGCALAGQTGRCTPEPAVGRTTAHNRAVRWAVCRVDWRFGHHS
jgi:hypothetical protein